jgi:type I restriction enzyme S subunit
VVKSKILMHRLPVLIAKVPTCFGQDLKGIILKQPWTSRYIARHLRLGQKWLLDRARGANTEGLTLDHLREYPVLVPPAALAERYEQIEQTIESQRERMKKSLAKLDLLFASLQHRAFRGEL